MFKYSLNTYWVIRYRNVFSNVLRIILFSVLIAWGLSNINLIISSLLKIKIDFLQIKSKVTFQYIMSINFTLIFSLLFYFKQIKCYVNKFKIRKVIGIILIILYPAYLSFMFELISFNDINKFNVFLHKHFILFLAEVFVITIIFYAFHLILRKAWLTIGITNLLFLLITIVNNYKFYFKNEYLYPWDIFFINKVGEIGNMVAKSLYITDFMVYFFVLMGLLILIFNINRIDINIKVYKAIPVSLVLIALLVFIYSSAFIRSEIMPKMGLVLNDFWEMENIYNNSGLFGGLTINMGQMIIKKPQNYNSAHIKEIINKYNFSTNNKFIKPDIIFLDLEAFFDVTELPGFYSSQDPIKNFRNLGKNSVSGYHISPVHGGGTVDMEFEALTGISTMQLPQGSVPYQQYVRQKTPSIPYYFKTMGYSTVAVHTFHKSFYGRENKLKLLGFDNFIALENLHTPIKNYGYYTSDETFINEIEYQLDRVKDTPAFVFGISMQGHYPFTYKYDKYDIEASIDKLQPEESQILKNYTQSLYVTDKAINKLVEYLKTRKRPTVLMMQGDHLPELGGIYAQSNFVPSRDSRQWPAQQLRNMYAVPFVIWSNYKQENYIVKDVSSYLLPSLLLEYTDAPLDGFWSFLKEYRNKVGVLDNIMRIKLDGTIIKGYNDTGIENLVNDYKNLCYDRLLGKRYSGK